MKSLYVTAFSVERWDDVDGGCLAQLGCDPQWEGLALAMCPCSACLSGDWLQPRPARTMAIQAAIIMQSKRSFWLADSSQYHFYCMIWSLRLCISPEVWWQWQPARSPEPWTWGPMCPTCLLPRMRLPRGSSSARVFKVSAYEFSLPQDEGEGQSEREEQEIFISLFAVCLSILLQAAVSSSKSSCAGTPHQATGMFWWWEHELFLEEGNPGQSSAVFASRKPYVWKWALREPRDGWTG